MKKTNLIIPGTAALVALIAVAGMAAMSVSAASDSSSTATAKGNGRHMGEMRQLTDEEKATMETEREARRAEHEANMTAVNAAMASGDYNAWVTAVGDDCPMLEKINADNFPQLVKAHGLMEEAKTIMEELGIEDGNGRLGGHGKGGFGPMGGKPTTSVTQE